MAVRLLPCFSQCLKWDVGQSVYFGVLVDPASVPLFVDH